ncbi:MAG: HAD family hydrolase [Candidatus Bathyarchaeota archaeon]|nr:HAD family hydrolase [Candidatus Bathyarchaeota archaeon]MDH5745630.1 HAD family hydrolase [Candidatus Bathyarchaeota archaeon]
MTIKAVLFDMGNTLVNFGDFGSPEEVFQRVLISLGISRSLDDMKKAFLNAEKEAEGINLLSSMGKIKCEEFWHQWDSLVLKHLRIAEDEELARMVQSKWSDFVDSTLYPEVKEVLLELKRRRLKIGLISNAYEEEIHLALEKVDLEKTTFDITVGVDTTKKVKPNPDVFKYALKKLDVKAEEAIFVGDNVEVDYKGAENAGLHALLVDRTEKQKQSDLRTIKNLKEILSQTN